MRPIGLSWRSWCVALLTTSLAATTTCGTSVQTSSKTGGSASTGGVSLSTGGFSGSGGQIAAVGGTSAMGGSRGGTSGGLDAATSQHVDSATSSSSDTSLPPGPDPGCVPNYACNPTAPNTGDIYADCAARVNQFRACVCLPPLPRWTGGEACADQDSQYDSQQNVAHAGFQAHICTSGNAQDECPGWKTATQVISQCLAQMFAEGPPPVSPCTGSCYSTHGHYINMTGTKYKSGVACGFYTTPSGSIWAAQNFQ